MGFSLLATILSSMVLSLIPTGTVRAQTPQITANWVNAATIDVVIAGEPGYTRYVDPEPGDGDMNFRAPGSCAGFISGFNGGPFGSNKGNATLNVAQEEGGFCGHLGVPMSIGETQNAQVWFYWVDSGQIEPVFDDFDIGGQGETDNYENLGGVWIPIPGEDPPVFGPDVEGCHYITFTPEGTNGRGTMRTYAGDSCLTEDSHSVTIGKLTNQTLAAGTGTPVGPGSNDPDPADDNEPSCETESGAMAWIMCPVIRLLDGALNTVDTYIQALLEIDSNYYSNNQFKAAFAAIRNIAYIILIPIVLVMVIGTALGFDFVSAYTVKRALPRLLIAVVFIALSYNICVFLIGFFNELGSGTLGIITSPFNELAGDGNDFNLASMFAGGVLEGIVTGVGGGLAIILLLWFFGGTLLLFAGVAFLVLLLRQLFIVVFMLAAPLAILAWIFPGNDKLWKLWWSAFSKLLIMYPLIMAVIAMGRVFAFTIHEGNSAGLDGAILQPISTLIAYMIPYAFIPFTFKFAGGLFANVAGIANDRSKGLFDRQRERRTRIKKEAGERAKASNFFRGAPEGSRREKWNTRIGYASNAKKAGLRPSMMRGNLQGAVADQHFEKAMEESEKLSGARAFFANDSIMKAALEGEGDITKTKSALAKNGFTGKSQEIALGQIMRLRKEMGNEGFTLATLAKLPAAGTSYEEGDIGKWHEDIAKYTKGNRSIQGSLVAAGKSGFKSAQRYEVSEAGFGDHLAAISMAERGESTQAITDMIVDKAYANGGPAAVIGSRNAKTAGMFAQAINRGLDKAKGNAAQVYLDPAASDADKAQAQRVVKQQLAAVSSIHDQAGQAKQTVGTLLANQVFGREGQVTINVPGPNNTVITRVARSGQTQLQEVDASRGDAEFREMKKEYGLSEEEARRAGSRPTDPGAGFQPPAPGAGGPGRP